MRGGEEEEEDLFVGALMRTRKIDASTEDAHCALMRVRGALMRARDLLCDPISLHPGERCPVPAMGEWCPGSCLPGSSPTPWYERGVLASAVVLGRLASWSREVSVI